MRVRDLMSSDLEVVRPDTSYKELVERMLARNVSGLPVVDEQGSLVGIVTEADVIRKQAWGEGERNRHHHHALDLVDRLLSGKAPTSLSRIVGLTAGDIMSRRVVTASPDDDLRQAARTMLIYGVKRLPVVSEGHLVGLMSRADLMRYFDRPDTDIAADVEQTLANPLSAPEDHRIASTVHDGVVTLTGTVRHPSDAKVGAAAVWQIAGVVDVRDELVAREAEPGLDNLHVPLA
jgi:CBS domain-containing protein